MFLLHIPLRDHTYGTLQPSLGNCFARVPHWLSSLMYSSWGCPLFVTLDSAVCEPEKFSYRAHTSLQGTSLLMIMTPTLELNNLKVFLQSKLACGITLGIALSMSDSMPLFGIQRWPMYKYVRSILWMASLSVSHLQFQNHALSWGAVYTVNEEKRQISPLGWRSLIPLIQLSSDTGQVTADDKRSILKSVNVLVHVCRQLNM